MATLDRPKVEYRTPVDLVEDVRRGVLRIPPFQRSFKWEAGDVVKLFDSLVRGYPIGNLLLWRRPALRQELVVGALTIDAPEMDGALWVVDGQQRITSLVSALVAAHVATDSRFRVHIDLETGEFHTAGVRQLVPTPWLPVSVLVDTATLLRWMREHAGWLTDAHIAVADQAAKAIREFQIPTYVVTSPDEHEFREEFASSDDRHETFREVGAALREVVMFLQREAFIPHVKLLPYSHVVAVLVRFVGLYGPPSGRAATLLRRWVWRGAVAGALAGGMSVPDIRGQVAALDATDPVRAAQDLLLAVRPSTGFVPELDKVHFSHAKTKINVLGLLSAEPQDLMVGGPIDVIALLDRGSPLRTIVNGLGVQTIANKVVAGVGSGATIQQALCSVEAAVADSHLVDARSQRLLAEGDIDGFLARRAVTAGKVIRRHVERMAEWGARDGVSMSDILRAA